MFNKNRFRKPDYKSEESPTNEDQGTERYQCQEKGCTNSIVFTQRDRDFYRRQGYVDSQTGEINKPKRCKSCREKRKREKQEYKNSYQQ